MKIQKVTLECHGTVRPDRAELKPPEVFKKFGFCNVGNKFIFNLLSYYVLSLIMVGKRIQWHTQITS